MLPLGWCSSGAPREPWRCRGAACCAPTKRGRAFLRAARGASASEWRVFVVVAVHDQVNVNDYESTFHERWARRAIVCPRFVDGDVIVDVVFDGDGDVNELHVCIMHLSAPQPQRAVVKTSQT